MGMSTHVVGFRPADEKWQAMKAVYESCEAAGIEVPKNVMEFFGWEPPKDRPGADVKLGEALKEWADEYRQGYEVDLTKLPPDVKIIRFYNSW